MDNQYNNQNNNQYNAPYEQYQPQYTAPQQTNNNNAMGVASLVCGLVGLFCCNPLYLVSLAAIITGIIGMLAKDKPKGMAIAGLILGVVGIFIWVIGDILLIPFTMGASFFV